MQRVHRAVAAAQADQPVLDRVARDLGRLAGRVGQRQAGGQAGREGGRVRAARAVGGLDVVPRDRDRQVAVPVEEVVGRLGPVPAGDEGGGGPHRDQPLGQRGPILGGQAGQRLRLRQVGGDDGGEREQPDDQRRHRVGQQQPRTRAGHHDRVDHERKVPPGQLVGDRAR